MSSRCALFLKCGGPKPERPNHRRALLVYVRATEYGFAVVIASYDEEYTKIYEAMKLVPRAVRLQLEAARRAGADASRVPEDYNARRWVEAAAAAIFAKARWRARGRSILMNIDAPGSETMGVPRSRFRGALLSIREVAENLANWHEVHATFASYPSSECPLCGGALREVGELRGGLSRIVQCECGFYEDADFVPFYHWFKELGLPLPKHPIRQLPRPGA